MLLLSSLCNSFFFLTRVLRPTNTKHMELFFNSLIILKVIKENESKTVIHVINYTLQF